MGVRQLAAAHHLTDDPEQVPRHRQPDRARRAREPLHVQLGTEQAAFEYAHALEHAVSVEEAVIEDRHRRARGVDVLAVDIGGQA